MATLINEAGRILIDYPRVVRIRRSGKPMQIGIVPNGVAMDPKSVPRLWIRFVRIDENPERDDTTLRFSGYLAETYGTLEEKPFDALNPTLTQYVTGTISLGTNEGTIAPAAEDPPGDATG